MKVKAGSSEKEYLSDYIKSPEFRIHNSTRFMSEITVENHKYYVEEGETEVLSWYLPHNESRYVRGTVHSQPFLIGEDFIHLIVDDDIFNKTIEENASMQLIENNAVFSRITEVYLTTSQSYRWGNNALDEDIKPGHLAAWNLTPGLWDIKIVNSWSEEYVIYDHDFKLGFLYTFEYKGFRKVDNAADFKARKGSGSDFEHYQVERYPSENIYNLIDDIKIISRSSF